MQATEGQQECGKLSNIVAYIRSEWDVAKFQSTTSLEATQFYSETVD